MDALRIEIDKLLFEIGASVPGSLTPATPDAGSPPRLNEIDADAIFTREERQRLISEGRRLLSDRYAALRQVVCGNPKISAAANSDQASLAAVVADVVAQACGGLPPFTIAALVTKIGIKKFCSGDPFA